MSLTIILLNIIFLLVCTIFFIMLKLKCLKSIKISNDLIGFISRSSEILSRYEKKQEYIQLRNSIKLYSLIRIILGVAKPDYVSFFKYVHNYDNELNLSFICSVDNNGDILQNSYLDKKVVLSDIINIIKLKNINNDIADFYCEDLKIINNNFTDAIEKRGVNKIYCKNLYSETSEIIGFIIISYKDKNYNLSDTDKLDLYKIIEDTKHFL